MNFFSRWRWEFGLVGATMVVAAILVLSELGQDRITLSRQLISGSEEQTIRVTQLLGSVVDAETGQRGFLLTKRDSYLAPYRTGVAQSRKILEELATHYNSVRDTEGSRRISHLSTLVGEKFAELDLVLKQASEGDMEVALDIINSDVGRNKMMEFRKQVHDLLAYNNSRAQALREQAVEVSNNWRALVGAVTAINVILLIFIYWRLGRAWRAKERQTENMLMQQEHLDTLVQERTRQLEDLSVHLQEVIEAEKTRLSRELHDELGSILTAAKMDVTWVRRRLGAEPGGLGERLERTIKNINQGITVKRRLIEDLRPSTLTSFGLVVAARELAEESAARNNWDLQLELPEEEPRLQADTATALYRILQESLNNATKYAKAKSLQVHLTCGHDELKLDIQDDGVGFRVDEIRPKAHGLIGMKQRIQARGGTLNIRSQPGHGCHIAVVLPLKQAEISDPPANDASKSA